MGVQSRMHPCPAMDGNVFINRGFDLVYKSICRNNPVALFGGCILRFILYNIMVVEGENPLSALFLPKIKIKYYFALIIQKLCLPLQYNNRDNNHH